MDISGLESLIRARPILSSCVGVYILFYAAVGVAYFSERRKVKRAEEKINSLQRTLKGYIKQVDEHPSMLEDPRIKSAYRESVRAFEEN